MFIWYHDFPIGEIGIIEENGFIVRLVFGSKRSDIIERKTPVISRTINELNEYFLGKRKKFDIPLCPKGTEFQQKVWKQLKEINYGETASYKEIAAKVENAKAYRAVGGANNKNPIPIIVPCHRVIGTNNKLVGFALGLDVKQTLLDLEKRFK